MKSTNHVVTVTVTPRLAGTRDTVSDHLVATGWHGDWHERGLGPGGVSVSNSESRSPGWADGRGGAARAWRTRLSGLAGGWARRRSVANLALEP
jgi:hypothetical protein